MAQSRKYPTIELSQDNNRLVEFYAENLRTYKAWYASFNEERPFYKLDSKITNDVKTAFLQYEKATEENKLTMAKQLHEAVIAWINAKTPTPLRKDDNVRSDLLLMLGLEKFIENIINVLSFNRHAQSSPAKLHLKFQEMHAAMAAPAEGEVKRREGEPLVQQDDDFKIPERGRNRSGSGVGDQLIKEPAIKPFPKPTLGMEKPKPRKKFESSLPTIDEKGEEPASPVPGRKMK